jgi:hypothetical protein
LLRRFAQFIQQPRILNGGVRLPLTGLIAFVSKPRDLGVLASSE